MLTGPLNLFIQKWVFDLCKDYLANILFINIKNSDLFKNDMIMQIMKSEIQMFYVKKKLCAIKTCKPSQNKQKKAIQIYCMSVMNN
jgi:hypothetical protein